MSEFIKITEDDWYDTYKPIKNHIVGEDKASFGGHMFETYGEEVEFVKAQEENRIWTYGDGDDGGTHIWNGWSFVNRIGYFITEVPFPDNTDIQIDIIAPDELCEICEENPKENEEGKWCESCKDDFKSSDSGWEEA